MCITMQEIHGQSNDVTLSEMSREAGGYLLAEDAPKVRALAVSLAQATREKAEGCRAN
jgi:hypothetical protein